MYEAQNLPLPANNPETNLAWAVSQSQALGWRVESATPRFVTMVAEGKQTNHVLHLLLTLATCGLWAIVWLTIAITNREPSRQTSRMTIVVDEAGNIVYNR